MGGGPNTSPWMEALPFFSTSPWLEVKPELIDAEDERTAAFLFEVGNSIHPSITVKSDYPSKNPEEKMPLLDLKLWVQNKTICFCLTPRKCQVSTLLLFVFFIASVL